MGLLTLASVVWLSCFLLLGYNILTPSFPGLDITSTHHSSGVVLHHHASHLHHPTTPLPHHNSPLGADRDEGSKAQSGKVTAPGHTARHKAQNHSFGVIDSVGQREAHVGAFLWFNVRCVGPDGLCSNSSSLASCVSLGKLFNLSGPQLPNRDQIGILTFNSPVFNRTS